MSNATEADERAVWEAIEDALWRHRDQLENSPLNVEHNGTADAVLAAIRPFLR